MSAVNNFKNVFISCLPEREVGKEVLAINLETNEFGSEETFRKLASLPLNGSVMLGVSTFFNLNAVGIRGENNGKKLEYLVVVDLSISTKIFWENLEKIICNSSNNKEALKAFFKDLEDNLETYYPGKTKKTIFPDDFLEFRRVVQSGNSWLSNNDRFKRVQEIFVKNHFVFICGNLCDEEMTAGIARAMQKLTLKFDTVSLSNVREFVEKFYPKQEFGNFRKSIENLKAAMTDETVVIDTIPRVGGMVEEVARLEQRTAKGFVSADIKERLPSSPPSEKQWNECKEAIQALFPKVPNDRPKQMLWCAVVISHLVEFRIVNT